MEREARMQNFLDNADLVCEYGLRTPCFFKKQERARGVVQYTPARAFAQGAFLCVLDRVLREFKTVESKTGRVLSTWACQPGNPVAPLFVSEMGDRLVYRNLDPSSFVVVDAWDGALKCTALVPYSSKRYAFSDDARFVMVDNDLYNLVTGEHVRAFPAHSRACLSWDGATLATAEYDGRLLLRNLKTGEERVLRRIMQPSLVLHMTFSRDGTALAAVCRPRALFVWDTRTGEKLHFENLEKKSCRVEFTPTKLVVRQATRMRVYAWKRKAFSEVLALQGCRTLKIVHRDGDHALGVRILQMLL